MLDILLPSTDAAVLAQFMAVIVAGVLGIFTTRRHPEVRILVIGTGLLLLAVMGIRAIH